MMSLYSFLTENLASPDRLHSDLSSPDTNYISDIPVGLRRFWADIGTGSYADRFFYTCDPIYMRSVTDQWLPTCLKMSPEQVTIVGYTSSNILYAVINSNIVMRIDMNWAKIDIIETHRSSLLNAYINDHDLIFASALTLWRHECQKHHRFMVSEFGLPQKSKVYGFVPALQIGGEYSPTNLVEVNAFEHWFILSQLSKFSYHWSIYDPLE